MQRREIWLVRIAVVTMVVLALPLFVPTDGIKDSVQTLATEKLGEPVAIERLRFRLLPWPTVSLSGISIGKEPSITLGKIVVTPGLLSLLSGVKVIRSVEINDVAVTPALLGRLSVLSKPQPGPQTVFVQRIELNGLMLDMPALKWGPLRADVRLAETGLQSVEAGPEDGSLKLKLLPEAADAYRVSLEGKQFTLPVKPALVFDSLHGLGRMNKTSLDLSTFDAKLYGGELAAPLKLDWSQGMRMSGKLKVSGVEVAQIVNLLSPGSAFGGRLFADGQYQMADRSPANMVDKLQANVRFEIKDGVLDKVDLASAAKLLTRQGARGGQTRFDELSGLALVEGKRYRLREIKVSSGALNAGGDVTIGPAKDLSGQVTVELKATASLVAVPLNISGTVGNPILLPSGVALAGAAVGTGLLGPGLGTAAGSKAGQALEKLFK